MTYGGSNQPRPTRNERREAAREKARILREEQKKRERRNKFFASYLGRAREKASIQIKSDVMQRIISANSAL